MARIKELKKRKHVVKALKKLVENFPPVQYEYLEKFYLPLYQDAEGVLYKKQADKGDPQRRMVTAVVSKGIINHKRAIKKAFMKWGIQAAWAYTEVYRKKEK